MFKYILLLIVAGFLACVPAERASEPDGAGEVTAIPAATQAAKLVADDCEDPDLSLLAIGESMTMCDGSVGQGSLQVDPWDLRNGVSLGSVTGKLKVNCRNMVETSVWGSLDQNSTIDEYVNGGIDDQPIPAENPWGSDAFFCGYNDPSEATWELLQTTPATSGAASVYEDKVSKMKWSRGNSSESMTWDGALSYCDSTLNGLNNGQGHGGISGWRLPTHKELLAIYVRGVYDLDDSIPGTGNDNLGDLEANFWSSTTFSYANFSTLAWTLPLNGLVGATELNKSNNARVLCIAP